MRKLALILITIFVFTSLIMFYFQFTLQGPKALVAKFNFGGRGKNLGEFERPFGLDVEKEHLFVADSGNNRIQVLKIHDNGNLSAQSFFGKKGEGLGEFSTPGGLAAWKQHLFVADFRNNRIQVLKIRDDGSLLAQSFFVFKENDVKLNLVHDFFGPIDITAKENYLYVTDTRNLSIRVLKIDTNQNLSSHLVHAFNYEGRNLVVLAVLAISGNHLYATDPENHRIQVWEIKY